MKFTIHTIIFLLLALLMPATAMCLDLDTYASQSRLADGKWVKISVPASGMYCISDAQLRKWGFSDPSKVRIYGYGGSRIGDILSAENYIDDLPQVQCENSANGLVFYGVGPESWSRSQTGAYVSIDNIYTQCGYYFLSETADEAREIATQGSPSSDANALTQYTGRMQYERDRTSLGESGYLLLGENLKSGNATASFSTPGATSALIECGVVSNNETTGTIELQVNGEKLPTVSSDRINISATSKYVHGALNVTSHEVELNADEISIIVSVKGAASMTHCLLDYIAVSPTMSLALPADGHFCFSLPSAAAKLTTGSSTDVRVWDVTDPLNISAINYGSDDGSATWINEYPGERTYAAWSPTAQMPAPDFVENVHNQNVHGLECPDMVIFTLPEYSAQAQRIANLHHTEHASLSGAVLNVNEVYNEFASGAPDVSALRKCLKMLYDRGNAVDSIPTVKYALLLGQPTYDNRRLTSQFDASTSHGIIPVWMGGDRRSQLSDNTGFGTDDFIAMLEDGSGGNLGLDDLSVAVGRIPARSVDEARNAVDKLIQYVQKSKTGTWKNSFLFLADDGDNGVHLKQTEAVVEELLAADNGQSFVSKVYVDAYDIIGGSCEGGRQDMYRMLDEGVVWWHFSGHANNHSWTGENMLNFTDINNMYLSRLPVLMAATCDFLRWDSNVVSGGEILYHERYGGNIATISATRPVYINDNGFFTRAIGRSINKRDEQGRLPRLGDIYRMAKNDILNENGDKKSNPNRLRYVLMGDPALQLSLPHNVVTLDSIGDEKVDAEAQVTMKALQRVAVKGSVRDPQGNVMEDFNGVVQLALYDAERSITTKGVREENVKITFEQHGDKLFAGQGQVANGRFSINVAMPGEIADNFRPATMNMYAYSDSSAEDAVGISRDFYVYGFDESVPVDDVAPQIERMVLNSDDFKLGDTVNESPMLLAQVSDDIAINLSTAGVGHQMTLTLDGKRTYTDVALFYTPAADGTPSGTICYPLEDLTDGDHTAKLRIWDTSANSASQEIYFSVKKGLTPTIYEVYTDANPASTEANFYVRHNRPDAILSVTVTVYNLMGRALWESKISGLSDMEVSAPVTWNLCDQSGSRVPRGIYLYRASITADGETYDTASRKLAVTAAH